MTTVHSCDENTKPGEALRDAGCERAGAKNRAAITACQRRLIEHLREHGAGTIDDATGAEEHAQKYPEKAGNWRGTVTRELSQRGIIAPTGQWIRSQRPSRHATQNREWYIADAGKALAFLAANAPNP